MSNEPLVPTEQRALAVLREAEKPLTVDELLDRLPAEVRQANAHPRRWLQNNVLKRPEVGRVARGVCVYLPKYITGSTLRVPITGTEAEDGYLRAGLELVFALWSPYVDWHTVAQGVRATCELPGGQQTTVSWQGALPVTRQMAPGPELVAWQRQQGAAAGDSLLFRIEDAEERRCRLILERLAERDAARVAERNRQVADATAEVLQQEARRPMHLFKLAAWLLARGAYHDPCPPDPLRVALLLADERFKIDRYDEIALATKWDRQMAPENTATELWEALAAILERDTESVRAQADPFYDINLWLVAVGYAGTPGRGTGQVNVTDEELRAWAKQAYRFRVSSRRRKASGKVVEARGDQTLGELDTALRIACDHDTWDHLSEFYVPTGGRHKQEGLGEIYPDGEEGEGAGIVLGALGLETGDTLQWVYDFGDWIEHTLTVEAVVPADPDAEYPREVDARTARRRT